MNIKLKQILTIGALATIVLLSGCAQPGLGSGNYSRAQVRGEQLATKTIACMATYTRAIVHKCKKPVIDRLFGGLDVRALFGG